MPTIATTALRELHEELGIPSDRVQLLGPLTPIYVFASNFWVHPLVGIARHAPRFQPNPSEVAELVELPLNVLLDPANHGAHRIERGDIDFAAPHIECGRHQIWGATCMMLGELISVLQDIDGQAGLA